MLMTIKQKMLPTGNYKLTRGIFGGIKILMEYKCVNNLNIDGSAQQVNNLIYKSVSLKRLIEILGVQDNFIHLNFSVKENNSDKQTLAKELKALQDNLPESVNIEIEAKRIFNLIVRELREYTKQSIKRKYKFILVYRLADNVGLQPEDIDHIKIVVHAPFELCFDDKGYITDKDKFNRQVEYMDNVLPIVRQMLADEGIETDYDYSAETLKYVKNVTMSWGND